MKKALTLTAISLSAVLATASAGTVVHWTFDSFAAGNNNIGSITSNGNTLSQSTVNARPSATATVPAAHSDRNISAQFSAADKDCLVSDGVLTSLSFAASTAFTIEGWFNLSSLTAPNAIVSNRGTTAIGTPGFAVAVPDSDKKLQFRVGDGSTSQTVRTNFEIAADTWYFFAASRDTTGKLQLSVYDTTRLLGSWDSGSGLVSGALATNNPTAIGKAAHANDSYLNGRISEIRISDGVLAADQLLWTTAAVPEPATNALFIGLLVLASTAVALRKRNVH
ncbi:LamG domain-containing protein [Geminisphaera colitermitum]|uniref:LamG domain-containing protein n=1 Tax=Geminisphaera colitermitum TaxID=1148786 RepID=UPI000158C653|nr:LamG domain-containing protein [Geminisphaera colitermitum]